MSRILTTVISGDQCLSISLGTINTNFDNLDTSVCTTSSTYERLDKTTPTGTRGLDVLGIPGIITAYAGTYIPSYWALCNGSEVDKASYPALSSVIGDIYGTPSNSNNFKLPNLQSNIVRGVSGTAGSFGVYATSTAAPTAQLVISGDTPSYFGTLTAYPSGYYRVQYVTGGFNLGNTTNWYGHVGYACNLVYSNGSQDVYIGVYNTTLDQSYSTLINSGQNYNGIGIPWYYDFFHTGGPIYLHLIDSTYTDNNTGNAIGTNTGRPVYSLYTAVSTVALNYIISTNFN